MSDIRPGPPHEEDDAHRLAAEYALGVLDHDERRQVEARAERDATFASQIAAWDSRLTPLVEEIPDVPPPAHLWSRIDALIAPAPVRPAPRQAYSVAFWRWLSFGSLAVAAASITAAVIVARAPAPAPLQLALLSSSDGRGAFTALIDRAGGQATLVPQVAWQAPGRVPELWLVPASGVPVSLGAFDPAQSTRVTVPRNVIDGVNPGVTLAVSVEPPGGSPTGQPTGAIIATGKVLAL